MADVDENDNTMYQEIQKVMKKYTTTRTVKYAKHKDKKLNGSLTVSGNQSNIEISYTRHFE